MDQIQPRREGEHKFGSSNVVNLSISSVAKLLGQGLSERLTPVTAPVKEAVCINRVSASRTSFRHPLPFSKTGPKKKRNHRRDVHGSGNTSICISSSAKKARHRPSPERMAWAWWLLLVGESSVGFVEESAYIWHTCMFYWKWRCREPIHGVSYTTFGTNTHQVDHHAARAKASAKASATGWPALGGWAGNVTGARDKFRAMRITKCPY